MTQIPLHLKEIWATPEEARQPCLDLLVQILTNVINNPNELKYRSMNFSKIRAKFKPCPSALFYLFDAGFSQSFDGSRLEFQPSCWSMLEKAWEALDHKMKNPHTPPPSTGSTQPSDKSDQSCDNKEDAPKVKSENQTQEAVSVEEEETFDDVHLPDGLTVDDLDLLKEIQSTKDTTVRLSNSELEGKTREEKLKILEEKRKQFREEKATSVTRNEISREKQRRENVKSAQEAQRKREDYQRRMLAERKKREDNDSKRRKDAIREKIKEDKERRQQKKKLEQSEPKQDN